MLHLEGSCHCGAVTFACASHAPVPYQLCYCSICRKTAGGCGSAINLSAVASSLTVDGRDAIGIYRAAIHDADGHCEVSTGERNFCHRWVVGQFEIQRQIGGSPVPPDIPVSIPPTALQDTRH